MRKIKKVLKAMMDVFYEFKKNIFIVYYWMKYKKGGGEIVFGKKNRIHRNVRILMRKQGNINLKNNNEIFDYSKIVINGGNLNIGSECTFGENNVFNVFADIIIGDGVLTADRVSFITNIHQYQDTCQWIKEQPTKCGKIEIGDGSWLGINVTVLANTFIGKNCVVGANSVVSGKFDDFCVIAGNPARVIKQYDPQLKIWVRK